MARSGSFGKRPRLTSGNPTSLLQSLVKQQDDADWAAIQDAWKNGGTFDGQVVTDSVILAYMTERRDSIGDTNDPEYQTWNNDVQQMQFSIDEAKIGLQYKEGKLSAGGVANWYKSQLSKYPVDSQVYRTIAGEAADWAKSAASAASGSGSASVTKALNNRIDSDQATVTNYWTMIYAIDRMAQAAGFIKQGETIFNATDPAGLQAWLANGVVDPQSGTTYTWDDVKAGTQSTYTAWTDAAAAYTALGNKSAAATAIQNRGDHVTQTMIPMNTFGSAASYKIAQDQLNQAITLANGDPAKVQAALNTFADTVDGIIKAAPSDENQAFIAGMKTDAFVARGGTPPAGSFGGDDALESHLNTTSGTMETGNSELTTLSNVAAKVTTDSQGLATGQSYYGQEGFGGAMGVFPVDPAKGWTVDPNDPSHPIPPDNLGTVIVDGQTAYVPGEPIYKSILVGPNGKTADLAALTQDGIAKLLAAGYQIVRTGAPIGYALSTEPGKVDQWKVLGPDGKWLYTTSNPFTNVTPTGDVIVPGTGVLPPNTSAAAGLSSGAIGVDPNAGSVSKVLPVTAPPSPGYIYGSQVGDPSRPPEGDSTQAFVGERGVYGNNNPNITPTIQQQIAAGTYPRWQAAPTAPTQAQGPFNGPSVNPTTGQATGYAQAPISTSGSQMPTIKLPSLPGQGTNLSGDLLHIGAPSAPAPFVPPTPTIQVPTLPAPGTNLSGDLLHIGSPTAPIPVGPVYSPKTPGLSR